MIILTNRIFFQNIHLVSGFITLLLQHYWIVRMNGMPTWTVAFIILVVFLFLSNLILVFHMVTNFQPSSSSKQFVGTGGNDPCHVNFKHFGFTSTLSRLLQKELTFLLSLILVFYIVTNFQPSSSSKQVVGTGGNQTCHLNLKHFGFTSTPPELLLRKASFLSYLFLVFHTN